MHRSRSLAVVALFLGAACASGGTAASDSAVEPALQVQAAALDYVFRNYDSSLGTSADSYCVGIGTGLLHTDPSPQLLNLLRAEHPEATRLSDCTRGRDLAGTGGSWTG